MTADKNSILLSENKENKSPSPAFLDLILRSVEDLKFGAIEIIVHDSKVVQIEIKEKVRFT